MLVSWRVAVIAQRVLDAQAIGGGQDGEAQALQANGEKGGIFALPAKDKSAKRRDPIACVARRPHHTANFLADLGITCVAAKHPAAAAHTAGVLPTAVLHPERPPRTGTGRRRR